MEEAIIIAAMGITAITLFLKRKKSVAVNKNTNTNMSTPNTGANRGLRNNNPGNIRISNDKFKGEIKPSTDKEFKQFESRELGIRAIFVILNTYAKKYNRNTIAKIIERWAPRNENNTNLYIEQVEAWSGINRNKELTSANDKISVVKAIIRKETSYIADDNEVKKAYNLL